MGDLIFLRAYWLWSMISRNHLCRSEQIIQMNFDQAGTGVKVRGSCGLSEESMTSLLM